MKYNKFTILYVGDANQRRNSKFLKTLSKNFKVKDLGQMKNFAGCQLIGVKGIVYIHQPKILNNLEEFFGTIIQDNTIDFIIFTKT